MYELIIFDLDGTLLDTSQGIFKSVRYAEEYLSLAAIPDQMLKKFVGPPPQKVYKELYHLNEEESAKAVAYHREYGRNKGIYESEVYPGIIKLLSKLKEKNYKVAVATLKAQDIAEQALEYHFIRNYFDIIVGMDKKESLTKCQTIQQVLKNTDINKDNVVMIGDSVYDMEGAKEASVDFIGVTYGFGFDFNDKDKYSDMMATSVDELEKMLRL